MSTKSTKEKVRDLLDLYVQITVPTAKEIATIAKYLDMWPEYTDDIIRVITLTRTSEYYPKLPVFVAAVKGKLFPFTLDTAWFRLLNALRKGPVRGPATLHPVEIQTVDVFGWDKLAVDKIIDQQKDAYLNLLRQNMDTYYLEQVNARSS